MRLLHYDLSNYAGESIYLNPMHIVSAKAVDGVVNVIRVTVSIPSRDGKTLSYDLSATPVDFAEDFKRATSQQLEA